MDVRKSHIVKTIMVSLLPFLGACGETGGTFETFDANAGTSVVISADKRAIITLKTNGGANTFVCAEPQPDAMRAVAHEFAAALKGSATPPTGTAISAQAEVSAAAREALASLGARTPTVQLMRDSLYRTCEAVMNGILESKHVEFIASRFDNIMLGLHAIDGLTAMKPAPIVAIGTVGGATTTSNGTTAEGANVTIEIAGSDAEAASTDHLAKVAAEVRKIVALVIVESRHTTFQDIPTLLVD